MFRFDFTIEPNETQFSRAFSRFGEGLSDYTELWKDLVSDFESIEKKQFKLEGKYGSGGWPDLSPKYKAWKERHYPGKKILQRTMLLNDALTKSDSPGALRIIEPMTLIAGVNVNVVPYAIYHQSNAARTKLPQRKPIELTENDKKRWTRKIQVFLVNSANRAFSKESFIHGKKLDSELNKSFGRQTA